MATVLRHRAKILGLLVAGVPIIAVAVALLIPRSASAVTNTWTTDSDFSLGTFQGTVAANDQIQLTTITTFPIMWVANAGEATVSKIDTNTGRELARYRTYFYGAYWPWSGAAPSRTTVDSDGNVYVLNRHFDGRRPLLMKILATGGIDRNGNGQIDTSSDTDGNGVIAGAEMVPLTDSNGNGVVDPGEIQDERVAWAAMVGDPGSIGRAVCTGTDGNLWVGTFNNSRYYKVNAADGSAMAGPYDIWPVNPYGCLVDGQGNLWSASLSNRLGKVDTTTGSAATYVHPGQDYGIAVGNGKVYQSSLSGQTYQEFNPATGTFSAPACAKGVCVQGIAVAVASDGDIIVTQYFGGVRRFKPDGTQVWSAPPQPNTGESRGALIDSNGDIWVNHLWNHNVSKFRGSDGAALGVFPIGAHPYTYSDATGITALSVTTPTGFWTVIYDSGTDDTTWGDLSWDATVPTGATLDFRVRAANTVAGLENQNYILVNSPFDAVGRFLQIQVKFQPNQLGDAPTLGGLTVQSVQVQENEPPSADANGPYSVLEGGTVQLTASGSDPDGDPLTFSWDLDGDGAYETAGQNAEYSAVGLDGPANATVSAQVCDDQGECATDSATVTVLNAPPMVAVSPAAATNFSGQPHEIFAAFTDAAAQDTHTATVDWGDGSAIEQPAVLQSPGSGSLNAGHTYFEPGEYTITVGVTDDDGDTGSAAAAKTVLRLPVRIDIKPGSDPNSINLKNKGNVPVGAFTGEYNGVWFDAAAVDRASLRFAGAPVLGIGQSPQDPDGDGDLDMVFHFETQILGLTVSSTEAVLTGRTMNNVHFIGVDSVRITPPK